MLLRVGEKHITESSGHPSEIQVKDQKKAEKTISLPANLEEAWIHTVRTFHFSGRKMPKKPSLARIISSHSESLQTLWQAYTQERRDISKYLMDPKQLAFTYLLGFHLSNCARVLSLLARINQMIDLTKITSDHHCKFIDLGAGTGAMTGAMLSTLKKEHPFSISLWDFRRPFLNVSDHFIKRLSPNSQVQTIKRRLEEFSFAKQKINSHSDLSIISLGFVWNELQKHPPAAKKFLAELTKFSRVKSLIFIIDPASNQQSRDLMSLRDHLASQQFKPLYPCPQHSACPMLRQPKDWCFSESMWERSPTMEQVDRILRINRSKLNYSGYVLASESLYQELSLSPRKGKIIVGRPLVNETPHSLLCDGDQLSKQIITGDPATHYRGLDLLGIDELQKSRK